jgi:cytochrome c5
MDSLKKVYPVFVIFIAIMTYGTCSIASTKSIEAIEKNAGILKQGKVLYEQACSACHSNDLGGAFGFNLKDGEWIHGAEPEQIIHNIQNGFMNAGMPGFGGLYSQAEIESIVDYNLSKREGFSGLTYQVYQMDNADDRVIEASRLIKSGSLPANFADFQLPEVQHYALVFEGDFYTPKDQATRIWIEWGRHADITFEIDGEVVERDNQFGIWVPTWSLKKGKQHLKIIFHSGRAKPKRRNVPLIITNDDMSVKLFPASVKARALMHGKKLDIKAIDKTLVQRAKTINLPAYSISVGMPQKVNFAFNTRNCEVVGLWQGDMLNVGPNVAGRGEDASLPLGDWIFHSPQSIKLAQTPRDKCHYKGYHLVASNPVFSYRLGDSEFNLTAKANSSGGIDFNYAVKNFAQANLVYELPMAKNLTWFSHQGQVSGNVISVKPDKQGKFTLSSKLN